MAYTDNFPQRPVFMADFANGGRIDPRATFSRPDSPINGSNAPASAVHYWSNEKHLSSENLLTDSNGFPAYATNNVVTPSASGTFIDGTDAFVVTETTASGYHFINSTSGTITSGTSYTSTVFVKAGTASSIQLLYNAPSFGTGVYANYDLATPTNAPVTGADATATSTGLSGGWVKITLTGTATGSGSYPLLYLAFNNDDINSARLPSYTPASAKNFYVWEANVSTTGEKVLNQTSGQIHREYASTLKSVSTAGQPRFEYDPSSDGQSMGCLIESQATNLVTYSEDSTQWVKAYSSLEASAGVAPDGTTTAVLWTPDTNTQPHYMASGTFSSTSGTTYTGSVFLKGVNRTRVQLTFGGGGFAGGYVNFNLTGDGSVLTEQAGATGSISSCGNGWYRVTITDTADATVSTTGVTIGLISSDTEARLQTSTPNGYDGLLVTGFQIETGSFASSYIKSNSGSTTTRASDSLSVATADIGYTGGDVSIYAEITDAKGDYPTVARLRNPSNGDGLFLYKSNAGSSSSVNLDYRSYDAGLKTNFAITGSGGATKVAIVAETNRFAGVADGGTVAEDLSSSVPANLTELNIGSQGTQYTLNGHCKRIALYNEALSDSNLQSLTAS